MLGGETMKEEKTRPRLDRGLPAGEQSFPGTGQLVQESL